MWDLDNKKKSEHWRTDAFELWHWRRLLRVPWMQGDQTINPKGNQPWTFIGRTDAEAEALILWAHDLLEKTLMPGNIEVRKGRWQRTRWFDVNTDSVDMSFSKLWEMMRDRKTWCAVVHWVTKSQTWLRDWTTTRTQLFNTRCFQHKLREYLI